MMAILILDTLIGTKATTHTLQAGVNLDNDKIGMSQRNPDRNTKPGWEMRREGLKKKPR